MAQETHGNKPRSSGPFRPSLWRALPLTAIAFLSTTRDASAYIDPNFAGWLFQLLFPLFAAVLAVWAFLRNQIVSFWRRITAIFRNDR